MALRKVVVRGDEILSKRCREVSEITDRIRETLDDMVDTMREELGVGLAAPQVGVMRRMFVAEPEPGRVYYMINPEIYFEEGSEEEYEGCLSVPGLIGIVERPQKIKIRALDRDGVEQDYEFEGFDARVMCHENDHLNGVLYTDKAHDIRSAEPQSDEE
ncbi:peptide deformylase [Eubacterium sulci ATCC 35585]|jgi:peptide deformylase|nr:peptide deformylase [Eubacterium sulci ATCC 35585]MBF1131966.1 peptide deformylase [[Eubacterium] sulci]EUC77846.1 peptide deformylase [Eubacterium sulci ATCC 35585]MBF1137414.1 peptide deformylase [[Eubacterium] sulci]MBF1155016.1 peptide deformylase [[Eubacterium] sulci]